MISIDCQPRRLQRGQTPNSRVGQNAFIFNRDLYIYGGTGGAVGSAVSGNLYRLNLDDLSTGWVEETTISESASLPAARSGATTVCVNHYMYLFGGQSGDRNLQTKSTAMASHRRETYSDVWRLDLLKLTWRPLLAAPGRNALGMVPSARRGHTTCVLGALGQELLLTFGGEGLERSFCCDTYLNDVWMLNLQKSEWEGFEIENDHYTEEYQDKYQIPTPRSLHTATAVDTTRVVVYGGISCSIKASANGPYIQMQSVGTRSHAKDQIHVLTLSKGKKNSKICTWSTPVTSGESPGGLYGHTASLINNGKEKNIIFYGGMPNKKIPHNNIYVLTVADTQKIDNRKELTEERAEWNWSFIQVKGFLQTLPPRYDSKIEKN